MGRRRQSNKHLPVGMVKRGDNYYHYTRTLPRKWTALGTKLNTAKRLWGQLEGVNDVVPDTLGALVGRYLDSPYFKELAPKTQANYRSMLTKLVAVFGKDTTLSSIDSGHVAEYLDQSPHPAAANNEITLLKVLYQCAVRWRMATQNPVLGVKKRKVEKRRRYVTDAEYVAIRDALRGAYRLMFQVAYMTGLRVSDVVKIKLEDFYGDALHVRQKKTGEPVAFALVPEFKAVIDEALALPRRPSSPYLFNSNRGTKYDSKTVGAHVIDVAKQLKIKDFHLHDVRAKTASDDRKNAQDRLGHKDSKNTAGYIHGPAEPVKPLVRKL